MSAKTAKILAWVQGPWDTRNTAGSVAEFEVPQSEALNIAREIAIWGKTCYTPSRPLDPNHSLGQGFPVTVLYASGRRRVVPAWE